MKIKANIAISESGFLFNPASGESFSLNPVAVEMFHLIKEGKSFEEIQSQFVEKYRVDKDTLEKDYNDFLSMLLQNQLVEYDEKKD